MERDMVDLLEVVKRYFYNVDEMHGSNSIKQVLPAVLNCSDYLKDKYSKPIHQLAPIGGLIGEDDTVLEKMIDEESEFTVANTNAASYDKERCHGWLFRDLFLLY